HLLDDGGKVIAQHDGYPVAGERLATGWLPGEYLIDAHALQLERRDYRGPARVEVGLYDPDSGGRVRLSDGAAHVILPIAITVEWRMAALSTLSSVVPAALALAVLATPIVLLHMLRLRRTEMPVSSTFLWQQLVRDREANAPWQRLRW